MMQTKHEESVQRRAPRKDGAEKREVLLDAAGQLFAEFGYADVTSQEICRRAKTNTAAVNYYFGGKEGLYLAVLSKAQEQVLSLETLESLVLDGLELENHPAEEKLKAFLEVMLNAVRSAGELWGIRVFVRELLAPTRLGRTMLVENTLFRSARLRALISEVSRLDGEALDRATTLVVAPCITLLFLSGTPFALVDPHLSPEKQVDFLNVLQRYVVGGLEALSKVETGRKAVKQKRQKSEQKSIAEKNVMQAKDKKEENREEKC